MWKDKNLQMLQVIKIPRNKKCYVFKNQPFLFGCPLCVSKDCPGGHSDDGERNSVEPLTLGLPMPELKRSPKEDIEHIVIYTRPIFTQRWKSLSIAGLFFH